MTNHPNRSKKLAITYQPSGINNFHNSPALRLRVTGAINFNDGLYIISARQAAKISKHFCGISDCRCPAGAAIQLDEVGTQYGINPNACRSE